MTVRELQNQIVEIIKAGGCDTPAFDAVCLLEDIGNIGRGRVPSCADVTVDTAIQQTVVEAAKRRANGEPLQYILGNWDFLDLTLKVGTGVLIPRPETEQLCEVVAEYLSSCEHKTVYDLCAGSGCIGLGIASLLHTATVTAVELSEEAFEYLEHNIARYPSLSVTAVKADVLNDAARFPDGITAIVSNPPYIPTSDLADLQREVQFEPKMALDGAADGYLFYRAIAEQWVPKLATGGFVAVEVGIGQAQVVARLFENSGLTDVRIYSDFAGVDRMVVARRG